MLVSITWLSVGVSPQSYSVSSIGAFPSPPAVLCVCHHHYWHSLPCCLPDKCIHISTHCSLSDAFDANLYSAASHASLVVQSSVVYALSSTVCALVLSSSCVCVVWCVATVVRAREKTLTFDTAAGRDHRSIYSAYTLCTGDRPNTKLIYVCTEWEVQSMKYREREIQATTAQTPDDADVCRSVLVLANSICQLFSFAWLTLLQMEYWCLLFFCWVQLIENQQVVCVSASVHSFLH